MFKWLTWFGRGEEKRRAYARLESVKQSFGSLGERMMALSKRTDQARQSQGYTKVAFELVEEAFATASAQFMQASEMSERIELGLTDGKVGDFPALEKALKELERKLTDLDASLAAWESRWRQLPARISEAETLLQAAQERLTKLTERVRSELSVAKQMPHMAAHMERIRMHRTDPVEASHLVEDLRLAVERFERELAQYEGAITAYETAADDLTSLQDKLHGQSLAPERTGALAAAQALLPRLKEELTSGRLDAMGQTLVALQGHLRTARGTGAH